MLEIEKLYLSNDEIDHGLMFGLSDDDHTQYIPVDGSRQVTNYIDFDEISTPSNPSSDIGRLYVKDNGGTTTLYFRDNVGTEINLLAGGGGDHGALSGLNDDDHSQYLLADGTRSLSANWDAGNYSITAQGLYIGGSNEELRFYEGANYVGFEAPALSADQIWVLPDSDGTANQVLTTDGSGNLNWVNSGDMLSELVNTENTINGTISLSSSDFATMHKVTDDGGSTQYTITLPDPSGNSGKLIGFYGDSSANLTRFIKLNPYSGELIRGLNFDCMHADKVLILKCDGTNWQAINNINIMTADETLNFDNSISADILNDWILALPHKLGQNILTFQPADGTYSFSGTIRIVGFSNGEIHFHGNSSDNSLSTNKSVFFDFSGNNCNGLTFKNCPLYISVKYLKIEIQTSITWRSAVIFNFTVFRCDYCYFLGNSTNYGHGFSANYNAVGIVGYTYVSNMNRGIWSYTGSDLKSRDNDDTGTLPAYGIGVQSGTIRKVNVNQPSGSTADEKIDQGGEIH